MILNYITFGTNEDFVQWQKEKERKLHQVQPFLNTLNIDVEGDGEDRAEGKARTSPGVFVLYFGEDIDD